MERTQNSDEGAAIAQPAGVVHDRQRCMARSQVPVTTASVWRRSKMVVDTWSGTMALVNSGNEAQGTATGIVDKE